MIPELPLDWGNRLLQSTKEILCTPEARIKLGTRNINSFGYTDDTTLMAESKEELKSLLMRVKEESERASLKTRSWHLAPLLHGK